MSYTERPSIIPGAVMWASRSSGDRGRILPDGCMDVIVTDGRVLIAGPDTAVRWHSGAQGQRSVAIRFAPGQAPGVLAVPAAQLVDRTITGDELWGDATARRLAERVAATDDPWTELEAAFVESAHRTADDRREAVVQALTMGASVDDAAAMAQLSVRQLHRRALGWFGYGPKHLARVLRFQRALTAVRSGRPLAATAADLGYTDQAHLARDARDLAGASMRSLVPSARPPDQSGSGAKRSIGVPSGSSTIA